MRFTVETADSLTELGLVESGQERFSFSDTAGRGRHPACRFFEAVESRLRQPPLQILKSFLVGFLQLFTGRTFCRLLKGRMDLSTNQPQMR